MADENEIDVKIKATDQTSEGLEQAKGGVDDFEEHVSQGFERISERLAEYFAIEKITEFVKESVAEFAQVERQMDLLALATEKAGESWNGAKEGVDSFLASSQALSGFTKDQLLQALNNAITKTNDLKASMSIVDEAQKLSSITGLSLTQTTEEIALAYQGNSRGLMQLGKDLGLTREQSKDAEEVFKALGDKIQGVGQVAGDTQGTINKLKASFSEFSESVGGTLAPLLQFILFLFRELATDWLQFTTFLKKGIDAAVFGFRLMIADVDAVERAFHGIKGAAEEFTQAFNDYKKSVADDNKNLADDTKKLWGEQTTDYQLELNKQLAAHAKAIQAKEAAEKEEQEKQKKADEDTAALMRKFDEDELKDAKKLSEDKKKLDDQNAADFKKNVEDMAKDAKKWGDYIAKESEKDAEVVAQSFTQALKDGKDAWGASFTSFAKMGIDAIADVINQYAAYYDGLGVAKLYTEDYTGAADDFLAGGSLSALAGTVKGAAATYLDSGGIVTSPTLSWVGERRPEAVIPLSEGYKYGLGTGSGGGGTKIEKMEVHVHGVQRPEDFKNAHKSIARQMSDSLQSVQNRKGLRLSGGIA